MVFVFILVCFMAISRVTSGLLHKLNRHALDLDRAIDFETSSGRICIPETIRYSKLYAAMVGQRMPALGDRLELVVQSGDKLPIRWSPDIPEFSVIEEDWFSETQEKIEADEFESLED